MLAEDQQDLSERFSRKGQDRFDGIPWHAGATGVPLLPRSLAGIECAIYRRVEMGDHDIFAGEMVHAHVAAGAPLIYFAGEYRRLDSR